MEIITNIILKQHYTDMTKNIVINNIEDKEQKKNYVFSHSQWKNKGYLVALLVPGEQSSGPPEVPYLNCRQTNVSEKQYTVINRKRI